MTDLQDLKRSLFIAIDVGHDHVDLRHRLQRIDGFRIEDGLLRFDLLRHPSLEGLSTRGHPSQGFFEVRQTYSFDPATERIELDTEEYIGMVVQNLDGLVEQDVFRTVDASGDEMRGLRNEDEVLEWASSEGDRIGQVLTESKFPPQEIEGNAALLTQWQEYVEDYITCWKSSFTRQALERWRAQRGQHDS